MSRGCRSQCGRMSMGRLLTLNTMIPMTNGESIPVADVTSSAGLSMHAVPSMVAKTELNTFSFLHMDFSSYFCTMIQIRLSQ